MAGNVEKFTPEQIAQALAECHGLITLAAKKLRCTHQTVRNYVTRYPELQRVIDDARGDLLDIAENRLYDALNEGDFRAVAFVLKCLGRERGWVEQTNVNLSGGVDIRTPTIFLPAKEDESDGLDIDTLEKMLEIARKNGGMVSKSALQSDLTTVDPAHAYLPTKQATGNPYQEYQQPPVMDYPTPAQTPAPQPIIDHTPPARPTAPLSWRPPTLKESE